MEPLSGESGNISKRLRDLLSYHCFNGAALRRERKPIATGGSFCHPPGFNGAALRRERKLSAATVEEALMGIASMEPLSGESGNRL